MEAKNKKEDDASDDWGQGVIVAFLVFKLKCPHIVPCSFTVPLLSKQLLVLINRLNVSLALISQKHPNTLKCSSALST